MKLYLKHFDKQTALKVNRGYDTYQICRTYGSLCVKKHTRQQPAVASRQ